LTTQETPIQRATELEGVIKKTRLTRLRMASRLGRESTLSSIVLVVGNLLIIAIAVYGIVRPLSLNVNAFVIAFSTIGLAASAYEWGAKPERKRNRIYESARGMQKLLFDIEKVVDSAPSYEAVEKLRDEYMALVGEIDENHTTADYKLAIECKSRFSRAWWLLVGNLRTIIYCLAIIFLALSGYMFFRQVNAAAPADRSSSHPH
jgi:hypothetical protein